MLPRRQWPEVPEEVKAPRMFDYFDSSVMEGLQYKLLTLTQARNLGTTCVGGCGALPPDTMRLKSTIKAERVLPNGKVEYLLTWSPKDIVEDEWVSTVVESKVVHIKQLSHEAKSTLYPTLFRTKERRRKQKHDSS